MNLDPLNRLTHALGVIAAALAAIVVLQLLLPAGPDIDAAEATPAVEGRLPAFDETRFSPPSITELAAMLDRPLFFADRRMPEPPAAAAAPPPRPLRVRLEGIAITGDSRVAVLRDLPNNQLVQLAEGMTHDGWTLEAIDSNAARFSRGPQVTEVPLEPLGNRR